MKVLLVDDESLAIARLKRLITEIGTHTIITSSTSSDALSIVEKNPDIDVAFIDIKMPDISGIELAYRILMIKDDIFIVFQTAYEEYALDAFKVGAVDYLIKPYTIEDIRRVFHRIERFKKFNNQIVFMVKTLEGNFKLISATDIFYIKAELKDSLIRTQDDFIYYPLSISKFEDRLKNQGFFRIHKSFLINTAKILRIERSSQSKLIFSFSGIDDKVISSKEGAKLFREKFNEIRNL